MENVHVVADLVLLYTSARLFDELANDERAGCIAGVALLGIRLDNDATIHQWPMVIFVLAQVVRVYGVTHIARHKERPCCATTEQARTTSKTFEERRDEVAVGACRRYGADLFVVEERDAVHIALEFGELVRRRKCRQGLDGAVPGRHE